MQKDMEKAFDCFYFEEAMQEDEINALKEKYISLLEYVNGIVSYEIISETIDEDGQSTTVETKHKFGTKVALLLAPWHTIA